MTRALQAATAREVRIGAFSQSFFPPGCQAENITILNRNDGHQPPLITIQKMVVQGTLTGMFTSPKRLAQVRLYGMRLRIPPKGKDGQRKNIIPLNSGNGSLIISKIVADGALLEFVPSDPGGKPYKLLIDGLLLKDVGKDSAMQYSAVLTNTVPPGVIRSEGKFGPWSPEDISATPVSGTYTYDRVNLGEFHSISGILKAHGKFAGPLGHIETDGVTETPDFHVDGSGLTTRLAVDYHAVVNGTNGDTSLEPAGFRFLRTHGEARGDIANHPGEKGKTATLAMSVPEGRIEDLLRLFIKDKTAPMSGSVSLQAKVLWPPGPRKFLDKLRMSLDFGIGAGRFASQNTQGGIDRLSKSAQGESKKQEEEDPRTVLSNLRGHIELRNGVANFTRLTFDVPGASAKLQGTYRLSDRRVDLHGVMYTTGKISDTTTSGFKALILKAITPFFKKKQSTRIVPFKITGAWGNSKVGLD